MNSKIMIPAQSVRQRHAELAAITLLIASVLVLPLDRLHTSGILLLSTLILAFVSGRTFIKESARLYKPIALLIAGIAVSSLFSSYPGKGWVVVRNLVLAFTTGALFFHIATERSAALVRATGAAVVMTVVTAIIATASTPSLWNDLLRSNFNQISSFANENTWGLAAALVANTAIIAVMRSESLVKRSVFIAIFIGLIGFLHITGLSRGALLSSLITSLTLVAFMAAKKPSVKMLAMPLAVAIFISGSALMIAAALQLQDNFAYFDSLSTHRLTIYKLSWSAITEAPLWGHGARTFPLNMGSVTLNAMGEILGTPHNIMLEALYSLGLIGTILWATGIIFFWRHRPDTSKPDEKNRIFIRFLGYSILIQLLIHGLFDLTIFSTYFLTLLFVSGGLVMATNQPAQSAPSA